jgi:hypothetical protein
MKIKKEYQGKTIHKKGQSIKVDDIKSAAQAKRMGVEFILEDKKKVSKKIEDEQDKVESNEDTKTDSE